MVSEDYVNTEYRELFFSHLNYLWVIFFVITNMPATMQACK